MNLKFKNFNKNNDKYLNMILFIIILGIILRLGFMTGIAGSDDLHYSKYAYNIVNGNNEIFVDEWSSRLGVLIPVALCFKLFGVSEFSLLLYPFLCSIAGIFLIYALGNLLFNKHVGCISAFLFSIFPYSVISAGLLNVDMTCGVFTALAVFYCIRDDKRKNAHVGSDLFLSGLFLGIGYLHKVTALWCLPVIFLLLFKKPHRKYLYFISGLLVIFLIESCTIYLLTDDPLTRWKILLWGPHQQHMATSYLQGISLQHHILTFFSVLFNPLNKQVLYRGIFYLFVAGVIVYYIIKKEKLIYSMILWLAVPLGIAILGTNSLSSYVPMVQAEIRHVSIIIFPTVIIIAYFLHKNSYKGNKFIQIFSYSILVSTTAILLFITFFFGAWGNWNYSYNERAIHQYILDENIDTPIHCTDYATASVINFLFKYQRDILFINHKLNSLKEGLIVINWKRIGYKKRHGKQIHVVDLANPESNWNNIKTIKKSFFDKPIPTAICQCIVKIKGEQFREYIDELYAKAEIYEVKPITNEKQIEHNYNGTTLSSLNP